MDSMKEEDTSAVHSSDISMSDVKDENAERSVEQSATVSRASPHLGSATGTSTPVTVELTRKDINFQRANYFLDEHKTFDKVKKSDSVKRFKYLIGLTDLFRHFIDARAEKDPAFKKMLAEIECDSQVKSKAAASGSKDHRHRKTEKEEDAELLQDEENEDQVQPTIFTESPPYIQGAMRDYQIQGLNWMISLYENNISGILADEMGLGKTLQAVSFLGYLRYIKGISGPHIIVVPKSTLDNWQREFARWTPDISTIILQGDKETRGALIRDRLMTCDFDVLITSYEMVLREKGYLKKFAWQYIIVDEAHRIKNEDSMLSQIIRVFSSRNRLLITGTPLQNNLHELWALLNFILPDIFSDSQVFDQWFESGGESQDQDAVIKQLHRVLRPFLLRRIKSDVEHTLLPKKELNLYIGMSDMQRKWYQHILEKDIDAVNGQVSKREKTRLLNIVMQLRKCCNHPYLFEGAEPGPPYTTDEHLIYNCGKMIVLDKLLKRAKANGSRVLIFSQMSRVLDILEDYCMFREYAYCRIDGNTAHEDRIIAIDEYQKPDSDKFIFLLTTRAGGLGITLTSADTVILYDSDWNPQADLQAMDRAHRIGQTKQVYVYRFVTENAIEEKVLERAAQKLRLDQVVIQQGRAQVQQASGVGSQSDLLNMIQYGAENLLAHTGGDSADGGKNNNGTPTGTSAMLDLDIEEILNKGEEKTAKLSSKFENLGIDDLQKFTSDSAYEWNGKDFSSKSKDGVGAGKFWINPGKRERKENYNIDGYYKDVLNPAKDPNASTTSKPQAPRAPKQINVHDFQFFPQRLTEIQDKETAYYRKQIGYKIPLAEGDDDTLEEREQTRKGEQDVIDNSVPLTEEEEKEKLRLSEQGFGNWNRRDFQHWIQMNIKHGRTNLKAIAAEFEDKTEKEIRDYAAAFWEKLDAIEGHERYRNQIEQGEERIKRIRRQKELVKKKVEAYTAPLQQIEFTNTVGHGRKVYADEEDRFLVVQMYKFGLDTPNLYELIRDAIRESPLFRFDWFILSRTPLEIARRCQTLITCIVREYDGPANNKSNGKRKLEDTEDSTGSAGESFSERDSMSPAPSTPSSKSNGGSAKKKANTLKKAVVTNGRKKSGATN